MEETFLDGYVLKIAFVTPELQSLVRRTNLAEISQKYLPEATHHIDSKELLDPEWLEGVLHLGIGAGTSTPKEQIDEVTQEIARLHGGEVVLRRDADFEGELVAIDGTEL